MPPLTTLNQLMMDLLNPTHLNTPLLMITPRLPSMLLRLVMLLEIQPDLTLFLFPMVEPSMSHTPLMDMMDMLLKSPMKELLSTLSTPLTTHPPLDTMLNL